MTPIAKNPVQFATADDLFDHFVTHFTNLEKTPGNTVRPYRQDRMRVLLDFYGNPQQSFKSVHVAGSKGKGSTATFLHAAFVQAGFTAGLYTSPHVSDFRERFTINMKPIPDDTLIDVGNTLIRDITSKLIPALPARDEPTTFELFTLLAYLCFRHHGCTWAVIEVGIGGRLDTTNILLPEASVITPIELEHTDLLGNDLTSVAGEKAGIIKSSTPVFVSRQEQESLDVIQSVAKTRQAPITLLEGYYSKISYEGDQLDLYRDDIRIFHGTLGMRGPYQGENAALAFAVLRTLGRDDAACALAADTAHQAFSHVSLPARFEVVSHECDIVLDAAHTPSSVAKVLDAFVRQFGKDGVLIFGSVTGKNAVAMASTLAPAFSQVVISRPGSFKKSDPEELYRIFSAVHGNVVMIENAKDAIQKVINESPHKPVLVCGSFYLIGEVRESIT